MYYLLLSITIFTSGCYGEFDMSGKVPRRDPCTKQNEEKYVYIMPDCRLQTIPQVSQ